MDDFSEFYIRICVEKYYSDKFCVEMVKYGLYYLGEKSNLSCSIVDRILSTNYLYIDDYNLIFSQTDKVICSILKIKAIVKFD